MKKLTFLITVIALMALVSSSCTRKEPADPGDLFGPSSFHYIVEGSANPSILWVNGTTRPSTLVRVRATDYQRNPLAGQTIYFQQMGSSLGDYFLADYGVFENNQKAMYKKTDANGVAQVTFYGPLGLGSQTEMFVHAIMQDIDQTYKFTAPQDYIRIQFIDARVQ